ncbi:MAG: flagellar basal body P-ring formation chaperone FlgA [Paracoccaceae bacterium]
MRWFLLCLVPFPAFCDAIIPTRVVKAGQIIMATDLSVVPADVPGTITDPAMILGQEARVTLYPGRPIRENQVGPPTLVARNQVVSLSYFVGTLFILTEGRALDRGGVGDVIPVLNLSSRNRLQGRVLSDGSVTVAPDKG